jgi:hypothetical protein
MGRKEEGRQGFLPLGASIRRTNSVFKYISANFTVSNVVGWLSREMGHQRFQEASLLSMPPETQQI